MEYLFDTTDYDAMIESATTKALNKFDDWNLNETGRFEDADEEYDPQNPEHVAYMCEYVAKYAFYLRGEAITFRDTDGSHGHTLELKATRGPQTWASLIEADEEWAEENDKDEQRYQEWGTYHRGEDGFRGGSPKDEFRAVACSLMASRVRDKMLEIQRRRLEEEGVVTEGPFGLEVN